MKTIIIFSYKKTMLALDRQRFGDDDDTDDDDTWQEVKGES